MQEHLFQRVSRDSSNTIIVYDWIEKKMKQRTLLTLVALIIFSWMVGIAWAQPTIEVTPSIVKPDEKITISGQGTSSVIINIQISNTRTLINSINVTADSAGKFSIEYVLSSDLPIDIYTVLMESNGVTSDTSFILSIMTQQQLAYSIRMLVEKTKRQTESALIQARKQGHTVPQEIMEKYIEGLDAIGIAENYIENQNYFLAQESLQEALSRFREVVEYSYGDNMAPPIDSEQEHRRTQEIIDQLRRQYNEINQASQKLKQYGVSIEILEGDLNTLRNRIGEAQTLLDEGQKAEAHQLAVNTQQLVQQRIDDLHQRQAEITKKLAERYQKSLENRVLVYISTFQKIQSIRPIQSALALKELAVLQVKLVKSRELLADGNIAATLREMYTTEYRLRRLSNIVNGAVSTRLLNRIDELTANLQKSTNINASQIEKEIEDTKNTLTDYLREKQPASEPSNSSLTP